MNDPSPSEKSLRYLRALGDPDRLKIVQILRAGPKSVGDISRELNSPLANVSHHLGMLKEVGIVTATKRGRFVIHELNHNIESRLAGTHMLDFGCCRIEFGEGKPEQQARPTDMDQALQIINQILGRAPASENRVEQPAAMADPTTGQRIDIVNPSFESPSTPFFDPDITGWQKEGDPAGTGVFRNFPDDRPLPGSRFVKNADGEQLATISARGGLGLFQSLDAVYVAETTYTLTAHVGVSSVQPPTNAGDLAPSLRVSLTYTDPAGERREVTARSATLDQLEPSGSRLTRVSAAVSVPSDLPCISRQVGIWISTGENSPSHAGHFILDQITLHANAQMPV
jgi:DNA-binding transcriptional ArsR family regulator